MDYFICFSRKKRIKFVVGSSKLLKIFRESAFVGSPRSYGTPIFILVLDIHQAAKFFYLFYRRLRTLANRKTTLFDHVLNRSTVPF